MTGFKLKNRIFAVLLCLVTVGGIVAGAMLQGSGQAEASSTLAGITQIRNSGKEFIILEIVPDTSQAAFAWYVGGSEPVNSTKLAVAYADDFGGYQTSYTNTTAMLQGQNYLLPSSESSDPSTGILQYLGNVTANGNSLEGGYSNNEWFNRYVLDWSDDEVMPNVRVMTVSPSSVTTGHIDLADMVVVSGGYYYPDMTATPMGYSASASDNLATDVTNAIISKVSSSGSGNMGMPVILDRRAYNEEANESLNSNRLFHEILKDSPTNVASGVYGSVFYYSAVSSASEVGNAIVLANGGRLGITGNNQGFLVTPQFHDVFDSSMTTGSGNFSVVLDSIKSENATRGGVNLLSEEVTMARVIRYLVGGSDLTSTVEQSDKSSVTILSIQPGNSSGAATFANAQSNGLSAPSVTAMVSLPTGGTAGSDDVSWEHLETWTGVSRSGITVVEMSMNEFISSSDSLVGTYDLIYLGNDVSGSSYGVYSESASFGSGSGNFFGLTGSGSSVEPSYQVATRDLTPTKYSELLEYVNAGRPLVLAPYLCAGLNVNTSLTTPSDSTVDTRSNMYSFMNNVSTRSNVVRQDMLIAGSDGIEGNGDESSAVAAVLAAVNIPTPTITFSTLSALSDDEYSTVFSDSGTVDGVLEYIFQINNDTLSHSTGAAYKLSAYLDVDGDGVFETNVFTFDDVTLEQLQTSLDGALVVGSDGNPVREATARYDNLSQDQYYRLTVVLPDWVTGSVSWKLEVSSYDYSGAVGVSMASTYVSSEARTFKVLQITSDTVEGMASDLTIHGYEGYADLMKELVDDYNLTLSFDSVETSKLSTVTDATLNNYDIVLVGFFSSVDDGDIIEKLKSFNGSIIFANASMSKDYLDASNKSSHAFAPVNPANLEACATTSYTEKPYEIATTRVDADTNFMMYYGYHFFTNLSMRASGDLELWIDIIVAVAQRTIDVVRPTAFDGELNVYSGANSTFMIGTSDSNKNVENSLVLNDSDLSGELPIYFTIGEDINEFTVGVRWKPADADGKADDDWYWDSNYKVINNSDAEANPLIGLKAYTTVGSSEVSKVMGSKFTEFTDDNDGTTQHEFTIELLPDMEDLLTANPNSYGEVYILTLGNEIVRAEFFISFEEKDTGNLIKGQGSEFFYLYYEEDDDGDYVQHTDGSYMLRPTSFYTKENSQSYSAYNYSEDREATHYKRYNSFTYVPLPDDEDDYPDDYEEYGYYTLYVYSYYKYDSNGAYYYKDGEYYEYGAFYSKDTNMHTNSSNTTNPGGLFSMG